MNPCRRKFYGVFVNSSSRTEGGAGSAVSRVTLSAPEWLSTRSSVPESTVAIPQSSERGSSS